MRYVPYVIMVLAAVLITLVIFLAFQYVSLRRMEIIDGHQALIAMLLRNHAPLPVTDASIIRSWMTFDYVNRIFGLPANYLQTKFMVTDTHYPKITLSGYAKEIHEEQTMFLMQLEQAVQTYTTSTSS